MSDRAKDKDNLVLFPKTLDYYQIQLTKMLETERYGDAKTLLSFLIQCGGDAERHHTEWQALLGWLNAAFPDAETDGGMQPRNDDESEEDMSESDWLRKRVEDRAQQDADYVPGLIEALRSATDPEQQSMAIRQLQHAGHPEVESALREWLKEREHHPSIQFKALQALRSIGATGSIEIRRDGKWHPFEIGDTPLEFEEFPYAVQSVVERVRMAAEVSDPTLAYFAEEMWKEFVQVAYGTPVYQTIIAEDDGTADIWAAALHEVLIEKLHGTEAGDEIREQYGITDELRFRYEQALRWLRQYAAVPKS